MHLGEKEYKGSREKQAGKVKEGKLGDLWMWKQICCKGENEDKELRSINEASEVNAQIHI